jgi:hypothetical protein
VPYKSKIDNNVVCSGSLSSSAKCVKWRHYAEARAKRVANVYVRKAKVSHAVAVSFLILVVFDIYKQAALRSGR